MNFSKILGKTKIIFIILLTIPFIGNTQEYKVYLGTEGYKVNVSEQMDIFKSSNREDRLLMFENLIEIYGYNEMQKDLFTGMNSFLIKDKMVLENSKYWLLKARYERNKLNDKYKGDINTFLQKDGHNFFDALGKASFLDEKQKHITETSSLFWGFGADVIDKMNQSYNNNQSVNVGNQIIGFFEEYNLLASEVDFGQVKPIIYGVALAYVKLDKYENSLNLLKEYLSLDEGEDFLLLIVQSLYEKYENNIEKVNTLSENKDDAKLKEGLINKQIGILKEMHIYLEKLYKRNPENEKVKNDLIIVEKYLDQVE